MTLRTTRVTDQLGIMFPVLGGGLYPCTSPKYVAEVSKNGGIGIIQPVSFTYVYGYDFREAIQEIKSVTSNPFGLNVLLEFPTEGHRKKMEDWIAIALEEGCTFFVTALGKPNKIVEQVHASGGIVYHKCTTRKHAESGIKGGVDGLILVNNQAGGHAGGISKEDLLADCRDFGVPLVCAGGLSTGEDIVAALDLGYEGALLGTRLIATHECEAHQDYKEAIVDAKADDIVLTERVTGIPLSVIRTDDMEDGDLTISKFEKWLFKFPRTKKWLRTWYNIRAARQFKRSNLKGFSPKDFYQAGKGVERIDAVESMADVFEEFRAALEV